MTKRFVSLWNKLKKRLFACQSLFVKNNLKTIGVIASGFDFTYPTSNKTLYQNIENGYGALISEYYPTFEPMKFRFPQRNRIVSGLSYGTLVAEASLKSGNLEDRNTALEELNQ